MIASYIMDCLKRQKTVVFSWGFHKATALENGLRFSVNGFIHKGLVDVLYNDGLDLFEIKLTKNNKVITYIPNVYIDELIDTLDRHIEKVDNYNETVKSTYFIL